MVKPKLLKYNSYNKQMLAVIYKQEAFIFTNILYFSAKKFIVGKNKLERFAELEALSNTLQPKLDNWFDTFEHQGKWAENIFKNNQPIVLELGCGKGEYTVGLGRQYTEKNFIGVDRKGARIWRGAKTAAEEGIDNVRFLRVHIDKIDQFFWAGRSERDLGNFS